MKIGLIAIFSVLRCQLINDRDIGAEFDVISANYAGNAKGAFRHAGKQRKKGKRRTPPKRTAGEGKERARRGAEAKQIHQGFGGSVVRRELTVNGVVLYRLLVFQKAREAATDAGAAELLSGKLGLPAHHFRRFPQIPHSMGKRRTTLTKWGVTRANWRTGCRHRVQAPVRAASGGTSKRYR